MNDINPRNKLEVLLFMKGEPQTKKYIMDTLDISVDTLTEYINALRTKYSGDSGIVVIESDLEIALGTHPDLSSFVESIEKEERGGELSKASLETLSIILYKNGATRSEIDYIRGVNSSFILRNLYLRGLVTKADSDKRSPTYIATLDLLRYLGIQSASELPGYDEYIASLQASTETPADGLEQ